MSTTNKVYSAHWYINRPLIENGSFRNFPGIFQSRMKEINGGYKLIEFFSAGRNSADAVVNVYIAAV